MLDANEMEATKTFNSDDIGRFYITLELHVMKGKIKPKRSAKTSRVPGVTPTNPENSDDEKARDVASSDKENTEHWRYAYRSHLCIYPDIFVKVLSEFSNNYI